LTQNYTTLDVVTHMGRGLSLGSQPRPSSQGGTQFCGLSATYAYTVRPRTTKFGVVTHMGKGVLGQPRHCSCTNASRDLSAAVEFLVPIIPKMHHNSSYTQQITTILVINS